MNPIRTYNVEAGLPTLDDARRSDGDRPRREERFGSSLLGKLLAELSGGMLRHRVGYKLVRF